MTADGYRPAQEENRKPLDSIYVVESISCAELAKPHDDGVVEASQPQDKEAYRTQKPPRSLTIDRAMVARRRHGHEGMSPITNDLPSFLHGTWADDEGSTKEVVGWAVKLESDSDIL